ncbi:unnamed protein product [Sphagnum jensenii]|uniref:Peptidase A2 domain-containing protein n=1 Tax=Sphagnum jensenii TaxID=128206 RepID=A0ABP0WZS4_9BRYO
MVSAALTLRRLCINKTHRSKTLHLSVEVNNCLVEGLVDTGASMSVMAAAVVRELGLMHLVSGSETYKTASGAITQALGRINEVPIKVGGGLIQVRRGPGSDVEVLPLTMVNMLQRSNSETMIRYDADALKHAPGNLNAMLTLQKQADDLMKKEITDADDYAD